MPPFSASNKVFASASHICTFYPECGHFYKVIKFIGAIKHPYIHETYHQYDILFYRESSITLKIRLVSFAYSG